MEDGLATYFYARTSTKQQDLRSQVEAARGAKPGLTEGERALKKKIEELLRVREVDLSQGAARELRKHQALLEVEIAELGGRNLG
jgi:hypothetical protein